MKIHTPYNEVKIPKVPDATSWRRLFLTDCFLLVCMSGLAIYMIAVVSWTIFRPGFPLMWDNPINIVRLWTVVTKVLPDARLFGWDPTNYFGMPTICFYSSGSSYVVASLIYYIFFKTLSVVSIYKIILFFSYIVPAAGIYIFSRSIGIERPGAIAAFIFSLMAYRQGVLWNGDIYQSLIIGSPFQVISAGLMFVALYFLRRWHKKTDLYIRGLKTAGFRPRIGNGRSVFRSKKPRHSGRGASSSLAFLSLFTSLIVLIHPVSGYMLALFIVIYVIFFIVFDRHSRTNWKNIAGHLIVFSMLALALIAFWFFPYLALFKTPGLLMEPSIPHYQLRNPLLMALKAMHPLLIFFLLAGICRFFKERDRGVFFLFWVALLPFLIYTDILYRTGFVNHLPLSGALTSGGPARFIPYIRLALVMISGYGFAWCYGYFRKSVVLRGLIPIFVALVVILTGFNISADILPMERDVKARGEITSLMRYMRDNIPPDSRALIQETAKDTRLPRNYLPPSHIFMASPMFTGRAMLCTGLNAPVITLPVSVTEWDGRYYGFFFRKIMEEGPGSVRYLEKAGIGYVICYTEEIKDRIRNLPHFEEVFKGRIFSAFSLKGASPSIFYLTDSAAAIKITKQDYSHFRLDIKGLRKEARLYFKMTHFPGWVASVDGKIVKIKTYSPFFADIRPALLAGDYRGFDGRVPFMYIDLPGAPRHEVEFIFSYMPYERLGLFITGLGIFVFIALLLKGHTCPN